MQVVGNQYCCFNKGDIVSFEVKGKGEGKVTSSKERKGW